MSCYCQLLAHFWIFWIELLTSNYHLKLKTWPKTWYWNFSSQFESVLKGINAWEFGILKNDELYFGDCNLFLFAHNFALRVGNSLPSNISKAVTSKWSGNYRYLYNTYSMELKITKNTYSVKFQYNCWRFRTTHFISAIFFSWI